MKRGYFRRNRHNLYRGIITLAAVIGTCYYVYIANICVNHYKSALRGHVAIITLFGE